MSDTATEVQVPDEVPPILYGEAVQCDISGMFFPEYVPVLRYNHVWDDSNSRYMRVPVWTVEESLVDWYDEDRNELLVHRSHVDGECEWCEGSVIYGRMIMRAVNWRRNQDRVLCNHCAYYAESCDCCHGPVPEGDLSEFRGDYWCESCLDNHTYECDYCNEMVPEGSDCDCEDDGGGLIQPYSTKFSPLFLHTSTDDGLKLVRNYVRDPEFASVIAMGLEFEMENMGSERTHNVAETFRDAYMQNHLMLKQDGSIHNGFELVTQPHTLDAFMEHFDWELIRKAQSLGMRGWDVGSREIGIHIHVNRKAFHSKAEHTRFNASPHLMAFMYFIYSNVKSITRIAGRNVHYGHMSKRYLAEAYNCAKFGYNQYSRTYAVNLMNDQTVELRMFRSTMRVERVQAYLQFAEAAVRYTRDNRLDKMRHRFNFADFAEWVSIQPRYEQLNNLIVETDAVSFAPPRQLPAVDEPESPNSEFMVSSFDARF